MYVANITQIPLKHTFFGQAQPIVHLGHVTAKWKMTDWSPIKKRQCHEKNGD